MNCKSLLIGAAIGVAMLTIGCGGAPVTIEITTPPPASLEVNQSISVAATTTHDSGKGVDWSCTPTGACGTFNPAHTDSAADTVYTAPDVAGPVTLTATSTKNPKKSQNAMVTINAVANTADISGSYTYYANGVEAERADPYAVTGNIVIDGATGMVTSGEQDYFDTFSGNIYTADPITGGTINVGADGRGTLTLTFTPGTAPTETFSITVVNNKHILITEFDANATAHGSLDLQTSPTSVPANGTAFALVDEAFANAFGGVLAWNAATKTATSSDADDDLEGSLDFDFTMGATYTTPDANGRGTITFTDPNLFAAYGFSSITLAYYVVGPECFRLIEYDENLFAVGSMYGQGLATFSASSLSSNFAFMMSGIESNASLGLFATAGQFVGNGTILSSGVLDANLGDGNAVKAGALTGSAYGVKGDGYAGISFPPANTDELTNIGVYLVDPAINVADPNNASGGGGALMLDLDVDTIGGGIVAPQTTGAAFTGNFAVSADGVFQTTPPNASFAYFGLVGRETSDGVSAVSGLADFNELNIAQNPAVTLSGSYSADSTNPGRATSMITINGAATPNNFTSYQASSSLLFNVDTDTSTSNGNFYGTVSIGVLEQQQ